MIFAVGLLIVFTMSAPLVAVFAKIPRNPNEGWNALHTVHALGPGLLYPPADAFISNNYPPLSFILVGAAGYLWGDNILAGRLIALFSLLFVAYGIYRATTLLGAPRRWGTIAALLFLLHNGVFFYDYIAMNDPQWLGQAFMMSALFVLLRGKTNPVSLFVSLVLMLAGGLVKHNMVALPLATAIWLALHDRRTFLIWVGAGSVLCAALVALMAGVFGESFFSGVLGHKRVIDPTLLRRAAAHTAPFIPCIGAAWMLAARRWSQPGIRLVVLYAGAGLVSGTLQRVGVGVNFNAHFDAAVALYIAAGVALSSLEEAPPRWLMFNKGTRCATLLGIFFMPLVAVLPLEGGAKTVRDLRNVRGRSQAWAALVRDMVPIRGPVVCESIALAACYWAQKDFALDPFNYGQRVRKGEDPQPLAAAIRNGRFAALVLRDPRLISPLITDLIEANYQIGPAGPSGFILMRKKHSAPAQDALPNLQKKDHSSPPQ